jgi:hypothetical protein
MARARGTGRDGEAATERRRGSLRAIAAELPRIAAPVLGRRGFAEGQLIAEWPSIIGEDLAEKVTPDRLTFAHRERRDGTLRLRVAPAVALEVQHREPQLLERLNAFFGYRAVARLMIIQGPPARAAKPAPAAPRTLRPDERQALERRLADVADPELRAALERLGAAVIGARPK